MQAVNFKAMTAAWAVMAALLSVVPSITDAQSKAGGYKPVVGRLHVDFEMPSVANDKPVKLSDFAGKKVLLIHFASW